MALTRKLLEGMGIEEKQVETIIEAHSETVTALKAERDKAREQAEKVPELQKQLEEAQAASKGDGEWEKRYNEEHQALEDFKAQVEAERTEAEKAQAYRNMLAKAGVDPKRVDAIMRVTDLSGVEMEDGKLKDEDKLEESAKDEWSAFIVKTRQVGSEPATPPQSTAGAEGADPGIAKMLRERHERLYGKSEDTKKED